MCDHEGSIMWYFGWDPFQRLTKRVLQTVASPPLWWMLQSMMKLGEDGITSSNKVIGKVTQFLSLSLTLYYLSRPQFKGRLKLTEIRYCFMKLGVISSEKIALLWQGLFSWRICSTSEGAGKGQIQSWGWTPLRTYSGEKTSLVPFFFVCSVLILTCDFVSSFCKTGIQEPHIGVIYM
jgi:hypothetical protein